MSEVLILRICGLILGGTGFIAAARLFIHFFIRQPALLHNPGDPAQEASSVIGLTLFIAVLGGGGVVLFLISVGVITV
jgi:hypothetical protein